MFSKRAADIAAQGPAKRPRPTNPVRAIIGCIQSGKTAECVRQIKESPNFCLVIVRNVGPDVRQFMNACKRAGVNAVTFSSDRGAQALSCGILCPPKVVVLLANAMNVRKARQALEAAGCPPFTLFIDEADKIAFSTEPSDRSFRAELERLQDDAAEQVFVTATMFNFMTLQEVGGVMTREDITFMDTAHNYCGIEDILFGDRTLAAAEYGGDKFIPEHEEGCDAKGVNKVPESLTNWIKDLVTDADGSAAALSAIGHPKFALARMGNKIETIVMIARECKRLTHKVIPIVYTGDGVAAPTFLLEWLGCNGFDLKYTRYKRLDKYSLLSLLSLQQFVSVLRESGAVGQHVIVVCAGVLAARGVNFTDAEYKWALTHEYFLPAKSMNVTELQQGLRLLGNKPWTLEQFRPILTTKHSVMKNIEIGCIVTAETRERVESGDVSLREAVSSIELDDKPSVRYAQNMVINSVRQA
jgi:hypothetical protein